MPTTPLSTFCTLPNSTLLEAAKAIEQSAHRTILIVDGFDTLKVIGVLSEGDMLRALIRGVDMHAPVREHMRVQFRYLIKEDHDEAFNLFTTHGMSLLPVVDNNMKLLSVMTMLDALRRSTAR